MKVSWCSRCEHYLGKGKCPAFPDGIPREILWRSNAHTEIVPGQSGNLVFEPKNPEFEKKIKEKQENYLLDIIQNQEKLEQHFISDFYQLILAKTNIDDNWKTIGQTWKKAVLHGRRTQPVGFNFTNITIHTETQEFTAIINLSSSMKFTSYANKIHRIKCHESPLTFDEIIFTLDRNKNLNTEYIDKT